MDNRISDKDLEFVNGGVNNSEEAISGAIGWLQRAVEQCARSQSLSSDYEPRISGLIPRLQSCNGDYIVIRDVVDELSCIKIELDRDSDHLPDGAEQRTYKAVYACLIRAENQLA